MTYYLRTMDRKYREDSGKDKIESFVYFSDAIEALENISDSSLFVYLTTRKPRMKQKIDGGAE